MEGRTPHAAAFATSSPPLRLVSGVAGHAWAAASHALAVRAAPTQRLHAMAPPEVLLPRTLQRSAPGHSRAVLPPSPFLRGLPLSRFSMARSSPRGPFEPLHGERSGARCVSGAAALREADDDPGSGAGTAKKRVGRPRKAAAAAAPSDGDAAPAQPPAKPRRTRRAAPEAPAEEAPASSPASAPAAAVEVPQVHEEAERAADRARQWVVFSDLHVSRRTLPTCLEVLERVAEEARRREAGVLFLGDWWHARGALPVDLLNAVIRALSSWEAPLVMIPGNHDQVNIGGEEHALTPIAAVHRSAILFSRPAAWRGALFVPYRRDEAAVREAVGGYAAVAGGGTPAAVFCHVDIVGAAMNDAVQAAYGLPSDMFPPGVPVYTGHYHKPHVVPGTQIRYVGSPYQVSWSEAGQEKALLILDRDWKEADEVPLRVGPRHFPASGLAALPAPGALRPGDRVRLRASAEELAAPEARAALAALRASGAEVQEEEAVAPRTPARIANADSLGPLSVFEEFARQRGLSAAALRIGREILTSLPATADKGGATSGGVTEVSFEEVELEGYGPFVDRVVYPLSRRGVVLITGSNADDESCDSNGSGKSTLLMAPLWALRGEADPRPEGSSYKGLRKEMVSDCPGAPGRARVRVSAMVNGRPLVVERVMGSCRPPHQLRVSYGGEDLTCQEVAATQERLDALLDTRLLTRTVFHGQHAAAAGLLEASDAALKDELSKVVDMAVWTEGAEAAGARLKAAREDVRRLEGEAAAGQALARSALDALADWRAKSEQWIEAHKAEVAGAEAAEEAALGSLPEAARAGGDPEAAAAAWIEGLKAGYEAALAAARAAALPEGLGGAALREAEKRAEAEAEAARGRLEGWRGAVEKLRELEARLQKAAAAAGSWEAGREQRARGLDEAAGRALERLAAAAATKLKAGAEAALAALEARLADAEAAAAACAEAEKAALAEEEARAAAAEAASAAAQAASVEAATRHKAGAKALKAARAGEADGATCERCLQPVDPKTRAEHVAHLAEEVKGLEKAAEKAKAAAEAAAAALAAARKEAQGAAGERRRRREAAAKEAAEARAALEGGRKAAEEAAALRAQAAAARAEPNPHAAEREAIAAEGPPAERLAAGEPEPVSGARLGPADRLKEAKLASERAEREAKEAEGRLAEARKAVREAGKGHLEELRALQEAAERAGRRLHEGREAAAGAAAARRRAAEVKGRANVYAAEAARGERAAREAERKLAAAEASLQTAAAAASALKEVEEAFGRGGVQGYVLEAALQDLEGRAGEYLHALSAGALRMEISPVREKKAGGTSEKITKRLLARRADGSLAERALRQLSGGQWRRQGLALALAFADFCQQRTGIRSNLIVLDEVLQSLDAEGRQRVAGVVRSLPYDSILVVSHEVDFAPFDRVDRVLRSGDRSSVTLNAGHR